MHNSVCHLQMVLLFAFDLYFKMSVTGPNWEDWVLDKWKERPVEHLTNYKPLGSPCSVSQDVPWILGSTKVHYCVRKSLSLVPVLNQMNPVCTGFNIFLQSVPRLSVWSLSFGFYPPKPCMCFFSFCVCHASNPPLFNYNIWQGVQIIALLLYSFLQPFFTASLFGPNIFSSLYAWMPFMRVSKFHTHRRQ